MSDKNNEIFSNITQILEEKKLPLIIFTLLILFFFVLYIVYYLNPSNIKNSKFSIIGILIFLFFEIQILFIFLNKNNSMFENYKNVILKSTGISIIALFTIYFIFYASTNFFGKNILSNFVLLFLIALLIITVLGIIYLLFDNHKDLIKKMDSKNINNANYKFIKEVIFYIPCLLIDLIESIGKFLGSTPKIGYILLLITILLVITILKLPTIIKNIGNKNNLLLKGPVYLNQKEELGVFQQFTKNYKPILSKYNKNIKVKDYQLDIEYEKYNSNIPFSYNYDLECEVYINPQPSNTNYSYNKYTNILNYGQKPKIEFLGKDNKIKISCQTNKNKNEVIYESLITNDNYFRLQKWNKILIKYDGANMDVFINSHLVGTKKNIIPHMNYDKIIIGQENGIYGGIKNVYFNNYNKPVDKIDNSDFTI